MADLTITEEPLKKMSEEEQPLLNQLPSEEQQVYHQLGPLYQKIYLNVLNDEERHRVVVYTKRGLNPFDAVNVILRREERSYLQEYPQDKVVPSERFSQSSSNGVTVY